MCSGKNADSESLVAAGWLAFRDRYMRTGVGGRGARALLRSVAPGLPCWLTTASVWETPAGFDGLLPKPFGRAELRACLEEMRELRPLVVSAGGT